MQEKYHEPKCHAEMPRKCQENAMKMPENAKKMPIQNAKLKCSAKWQAAYNQQKLSSLSIIINCLKLYLHMVMKMPRKNATQNACKQILLSNCIL